jgi:hypothetical protein
MADESAVICALRESLHATTRNLAVLEARLLASERATERALQLQAAEYERRLEILNHAHTQRVEREATYVRRDMHEKDISQLRTDITDLKDYKSRLMGIVSVVSAAVAMAVNMWWWRGG